MVKSAVYLYVCAYTRLFHTRTGEGQQRVFSFVRTWILVLPGVAFRVRRVYGTFQRARARCVPSALYFRKQIRPDGHRTFLRRRAIVPPRDR